MQIIKMQEDLETKGSLTLVVIVVVLLLPTSSKKLVVLAMMLSCELAGSA